MPDLALAPPFSAVEPVTEILHGVSVTDPYRWLEDQDSPRTRAWIEEQIHYARSYLTSIPGRDRIRDRVREFLALQTYDSLQIVGNRYFFRKRRPEQQQACIYMREGADGEDQLLVDPRDRGTGNHTAVRPIRVSPDGRLLLYEVKEGGERTGTFELVEIDTRMRLPDFLPRGYLRGFAFAPGGKSFYYVHERVDAKVPIRRAAYHHALGTAFGDDREVFFAGDGERVRVGLLSDKERLAFLVYRFLEKTLTDIYLMPFGAIEKPAPIFLGIDYSLGLRLVGGRILAITDRDAPNRRIVEIRLRSDGHPEWIDIVPESRSRIVDWHITSDRMFVSYMAELTHRIYIFDHFGKTFGELPTRTDQTTRIIGSSPDRNEILLETESFTEPVTIFRCSIEDNELHLWAKKSAPFDSPGYGHCRVWFRSKDGTRIPMYLVGRRHVLAQTNNPTIMTSYGGFGVSMTPQFSVFVAFLLERGCIFALPNIRGGSEFGAEWHHAARRCHRQTAFNDFLSAAEWLLQTGRTAPGKLAIFGGSNSGLLVAAALTQRPDLFGAVLCMVPMLDMLRYHLFDNAHVWKEEFGTAEDAEDFSALAKYSPYHQVRKGVAYPATMIVSGDADRNCNPLHARKMTARLQAANIAHRPIFLDYNKFRGHSAVLPLDDRVEALTDRLAFFCDQMRLPV